jgi:hypothetical protein
MKPASFIIASVVVTAANAESANRVIGHHQDGPQDKEGLRLVAERRGAKLRGADSNQRIPGSNAYHRARILTGSMSMSAPIFEAKAGLSMPSRFVLPAEPDLIPAAMEEEGADEDGFTIVTPRNTL